MADPIRELLSQTSYDTDGTTTVWNFSFAGGYIDRAHVKVQLMDKVTLNIVQVPITNANFVGDYQLLLEPAFPVGSELTIYRDSPKDLPLVNFTDKAALTESSLDLNARQAIFVAAESSDQLATSLQAVSQVTAQVEAAKNFAEAAEADAAAAAGAAATAGTDASSAAASAATATTQAGEATAAANISIAAKDIATTAASTAVTSSTAAAASEAAALASKNAAAASEAAALASKNAAATSASAAAGSATAAAASELAADGSADSALASKDRSEEILEQVLLGAQGGYLFEQSEWNGPRLSIPQGFIPEDGQQVLDLAYPEAVSAIRAGQQHVITEAEWQANPLKRNCWSLGNGTSWVRAPDNNGVQPGSIGKLYKAGDGGSLGGTVVSDAIRNITGAISNSANTGAVIGSSIVTSGAFSSGGSKSNINAAAGSGFGLSDVSFNASEVVPTAAENRPKTSYQCFIVRVATGVSTNGTTDLEALAAEVAGAIAEIEPLKARQKALGDGQTWQNLTASRVSGTNYTNTTGRPIELNVTATSSGTTSPTSPAAVLIRVGAAMPFRYIKSEAVAASVGVGCSAIIQKGEVYQYTINASVVSVIVQELR